MIYKNKPAQFNKTKAPIFAVFFVNTIPGGKTEYGAPHEFFVQAHGKATRHRYSKNALGIMMFLDQMSHARQLRPLNSDA